MAVRHPLFRGARSARALSIAAATIALAACSGGSSGTGSVPQTNGPCLPSDTQATLAVPNNSNGSFVNPSSINQLVLVTNGNNNSFATTFANYMLVAVGGGGTNVVSQNLGLVPRNGAPQPYNSDYYYAGSVNSGQFFSGVTYTVYLNTQNSNCAPTPIGQFQT
jgi:hypothetical protein